MLPVVLNVLWRVWEDVCAQEGVGGCFLGGYCMDWRLGLVRCMAYRWPGWDWPCLGLIPIDGLVGMTVFSFVQGGMISLMRRLFFFFFNKDGMGWDGMGMDKLFSGSGMQILLLRLLHLGILKLNA